MDLIRARGGHPILWGGMPHLSDGRAFLASHPPPRQAME